jgi:NADH:ubiquinone reductase (H+-translocating)
MASRCQGWLRSQNSRVPTLPASSRLAPRVENNQHFIRYRDAGSLATIGRRRAVAQIGPLKLKGFAAWLLWCVAHIYFLIGFRNRAIVATNWAWNYITFQSGTRLITGMTGARAEAMPAPISKEPRNSGDVRHAA